MCMITLYRGSVKEENKLSGDIERYALDVASGILTVYPLLKEAQEFRVSRTISWDESDDSMVIE